MAKRNFVLIHVKKNKQKNPPSVLAKRCVGTFLQYSTQQQHQVNKDFFSFHFVFTNLLLFGSICNALMQKGPNVCLQFSRKQSAEEAAVTDVAVCFAGIHGDILYPLRLHPHPNCTGSAPKRNLGDQRTSWNMIHHFNFLFLFLIIGHSMNPCLSFKAAAGQNVTLVDLSEKIVPVPKTSFGNKLHCCMLMWNE